MAQKLDKTDLEKSCQNFLYVFIPENLVSDLEPSIPNLRAKRNIQIEILKDKVSFSQSSWDDARNIIGAAIQRRFGKTPGQCLELICLGKRIPALDGSNDAIVAGIGANVTYDSNGVPQGAIFDENSILTYTYNGKKYSATFDVETGLLNGWYDVESGSQLNHVEYTNKGVSWQGGADPGPDYWGKAQNSIGAFTNIWQSIVELIQLILGIVSVKKSDAAKAATTQSDLIGRGISSTAPNQPFAKAGFFSDGTIIPVALGLIIVGSLIKEGKKNKNKN